MIECVAERTNRKRPDKQAQDVSIEAPGIPPATPVDERKYRAKTDNNKAKALVHGSHSCLQHRDVIMLKRPPILRIKPPAALRTAVAAVRGDGEVRE